MRDAKNRRINKILSYLQGEVPPELQNEEDFVPVTEPTSVTGPNAQPAPDPLMADVPPVPVDDEDDTPVAPVDVNASYLKPRRRIKPGLV